MGLKTGLMVEIYKLLGRENKILQPKSGTQGVPLIEITWKKSCKVATAVKPVSPQGLQFVGLIPKCLQ